MFSFSVFNYFEKHFVSLLFLPRCIILRLIKFRLRRKKKIWNYLKVCWFYVIIHKNRYWTQGGTLRNVPVGGGCRKGKRSKASSSSGGAGESSRSQSSQQLPPPHELQLPQNLDTKDLSNLGLPPMNLPYFSGGGFLSSLAAMQSLSQHQIPFNPPVNIGGQFGSSSSNLALLQGLNLPSFNSQQHGQNQQQQNDQSFYQIGTTQSSLMQPNRALASWDQSTSSNPNASNPSGSTSLNQNQWPGLPWIRNLYTLSSYIDYSHQKKGVKVQYIVVLNLFCEYTKHDYFC